jgi:hypothetical protein
VIARLRVDRTRRGEVRLRLPGPERELLAELAAELRARLDGDGDDPELRRLFPPAYADDELDEAEYRGMVRGELLDGRRTALSTFEATLDHKHLSNEELDAWLRVLNDLRPVLARGSTSGRTRSRDADANDPDARESPSTHTKWLQEQWSGRAQWALRVGPAAAAGGLRSARVTTCIRHDRRERIVKPRVLAVTVLVASLAWLAAGCGGGSSDEAPPPATGGGETTTAGGTTVTETSGPVEGVEPGGTYRVDVESAFDFTDAFDPTGEYTSVGWSFYTMLIRKLVTYRHTAGAAGNEPLPDLAADFPTISEDGLTYTFTLKDGIAFGPPVSREITSQDIAYAFERLANPDLGGAGYPNYYVEIVGFEEFGAGESDTITGIETPDEKTTVFTLEKPVATSCTGSQCPRRADPGEVARLHGGRDYGRYVVFGPA